MGVGGEGGGEWRGREKEKKTGDEFPYYCHVYMYCMYMYIITHANSHSI